MYRSRMRDYKERYAAVHADVGTQTPVCCSHLRQEQQKNILTVTFVRWYNVLSFEQTKEQHP